VATSLPTRWLPTGRLRTLKTIDLTLELAFSDLVASPSHLDVDSPTDNLTSADLGLTSEEAEASPLGFDPNSFLNKVNSMIGWTLNG
jgi:hypothetical protein